MCFACLHVCVKFKNKQKIEKGKIQKFDEFCIDQFGTYMGFVIIKKGEIVVFLILMITKLMLILMMIGGKYV
jgi:hypothetical protein